ncbi:LPXTG cell wall anchor domain-containing protein [Lactiplantibacillus herbarum]|uniref:LPXTG cell wall anchor domain-containing protein n=1 Tax=Lactiplantibacillus herbarum TaxID=1670446 RepID=UPI00064F99A8|nr:LPXTG cell wall anchor domain-containing protein [Lactiplantibacillus herbarum]
MAKATKLVVGATVLAGTLTISGLQASAANHEPATPANNIQRVHQLTIDEQIEANPAVQVARHHVTDAEKVVQTATDKQKQQQVAQAVVDQQLAKAQENLAMRKRAGQHMHMLVVEANARQTAAKADLTKKTTLLEQLQSKSGQEKTKTDLEQAQIDVEKAKTELENAEIEVSGSAIDDHYAQGELKKAEAGVAKAQTAADQQVLLSKAATATLAQAQQLLMASQAQLATARTQVRAVLTSQQGTVEHKEQSTELKPAMDNKSKVETTGNTSTANNAGHGSTSVDDESANANTDTPVRPRVTQPISTTAKPVGNSVTASAPLKAKTLPQTGETSDAAVSMLGLLLIGLTGWFGFKKHNHERTVQ